ncbi:MAG: tail fiber domain-containing protein [Elusimicrobiota bacterium]
MILLAALAVSLRAEAPGVVNYQGKLADSSGNPLTGTYSMTFKIYAAPTGGAALFTETRTADVPVDNGVFNVHIGSGTGGGIPLSVFQGGTDRYLGVTVGADAELTPRERLLASPYALAVASASVGTAELADGTVAVGDLNTASVDGRYVTLSTIQTITSSKTFSGGATVTGLPTPTGASDAAPKSYVDSQVTGGSGWTDAGAVVRLTSAGDTIGASGGTDAGVTFSTNVFLSTGRLGIGAAAAGESLDVNGLIKILKAGGVDNDSPGIVAVSDDDFLYDGEYINHYGIGFHDFNDGAGLGVNAYMAGYFGVDLFTGGQPRLRINSNGNVGIGSAGPGAKLDVAGDIKATSDIGNLGTGSGQKMEAGTSALATLRFDADAYRLFAGGAGASGEVLRVTETGSVGLSTGAPGALLDVHGNAQFGSSAKSTFTTAGILQLASALGSAYGGTGADLSGGVLGGVPYFSGAGVMGALGAGTAGQFLKSNGGAAPSWANVTASDVSDTMTLSTNQSASGVKTFTSSVTITANQFSVVGSTFVVTGGNVGIGTSSPSALLHFGTTPQGAIQFGLANYYIGHFGAGGGPLFAFDANDYLYYDRVSDFLMLSVGGAERFRINSSGNAGIGTSNPSTKLHMSSGVFTVDGSNPGISVGISTFVVTGNKVGIGTSSPGARLNVIGTVAGEDVAYFEAGGDTVGVKPGANGGAENMILSLGNGRTASRNLAITGWSLGQFPQFRVDAADALIQGRLAVNTSSAQGNKLYVSGDALITSSAVVSGTGVSGTDPVFRVAGSTFVVQADGKIGMGTASPLDKLHVVGGGINVGSAGNAYMIFSAGTGGAAGNQISFIDLLLGDTLRGNLAVNEATSGNPLEINSAVTNNVSLVTGGGNVGVGTTNPSSKLQVFSAAGMGGAHLRVSTGTSTLFEVAGTSVTMRGTLFLASYNCSGQANGGTLTTTASGQVVCAADDSGISSIRYKKDVEDLGFDKEAFLQLKPRTFRWKIDGKEDVGFVAEEVHKLMPELVFYNEQGQINGVRYEWVPLYLISVIKGQQMVIEELKKAHNDQKHLLRGLKEDIDALKAEMNKIHGRKSDE